MYMSYILAIYKYSEYLSSKWFIQSWVSVYIQMD